MRTKRTEYDFSKHTHRTEIFKSEEGNEIRVDHLQKGNSRMGYIKFVNNSEGLSVYGDFGNWIFYRPFHPSANGFVSDMYWLEKLRIASEQRWDRPDNLDFDYIQKELKEGINGGLEDYGYEGSELDTMIEFYKDLLDYTDDPLEYLYNGYRNMPSCTDYESIPIAYKMPVWLEIVFDAFDEICSRLKD